MAPRWIKKLRRWLSGSNSDGVLAAKAVKEDDGHPPHQSGRPRKRSNSDSPRRLVSAPRRVFAAGASSAERIAGRDEVATDRGSFDGRGRVSTGSSYVGSMTGSFNLSKLGDEELLATARRARLEVAAGGMDGPPVASRRPSSARHRSRSRGSSGRVRSNSTNSIYLTSTMSTADTGTTIKCIAAVLHRCIHSVAKGQRRMALKFTAGDAWDVYGNEWQHFNDVPSSTGRRRGAPTLDNITNFIMRIFKKAQMERDSIIIALMYIERLLKSKSAGVALKLGPHNWMTVLFCGLLISSKVWDDFSMWNSDFSQISPGLNLKRVNALEVDFLRALGFSVRVPASAYAKYYFQLRTMCFKLKLCGHRDGGEGGGDRSRSAGNYEFKLSEDASEDAGDAEPEAAALSPLKMEDAVRLEAMSEQYQKTMDLQEPVRRRRCFTIHDASDHSSIHDMMKTGYQYTDSSAPTAALEQIVTMGGRSDSDSDDDIHMFPSSISMGRRLDCMTSDGRRKTAGMA